MRVKGAISGMPALVLGFAVGSAAAMLVMAIAAGFGDHSSKFSQGPAIFTLDQDWNITGIRRPERNSNSNITETETNNLPLQPSQGPVRSRPVIIPRKKATSAEGTSAHFGTHLGETGWVQAWNVSARFSVMPFDVVRFHKFDGYRDGALEVGSGPVFERFVPWIDASIAPGEPDLSIARASNEARLTGMALTQAGIGESYFITDNAAVYIGLRAQHLSEAGWSGSDRNYSLNTAFRMGIGVSWHF